MRSSLLIAAAFTVFFVSLAAPAAIAGNVPGALPPATSSFADLADSLLPSVVNISSTQKMEVEETLPDMPQFPPGSPFEDFFEEFMQRRGEGLPDFPVSSLGSGFIVDAQNGYVVTNNHVVKDADEVRVTLHDDSTLDAEILGRDEKMDLAVLKVKTDKKLTAVSFGDSKKLRVGDWVLAIGNPFGLGGTVTAGIISAQQRNINSGPYDDFIQTDASINRGNSGGPMFNLAGEVIGINTAIYSPSGGSVGIGFAIPSNMAKPVIDQLIKYGHTRRGWLGVRIQSVTDEIAESLGLPKARGALVASITTTGPAEKAGLAAGDIILEFNGTPINEMRDLPRLVAETDIGKKASIKYWRDGKELSATVEVGELEKAEESGLIATGPKEEAKEKGVAIENVGMTVATLTEQTRETYHVADDVEGVVVTTVERASEASEKGIEPGDVIAEINQQAVTEPAKLKDLFKKAKDSGRNSVLLLVSRNDDVRFVALRLNKPAHKSLKKEDGNNGEKNKKTEAPEKETPPVQKK